MRTFAAVMLVAVVTTVPALAQPEAPKPGPEHEMLKKKEGTWTTVMKSGGAEFKGTVTYKMELGGLWLVGSMESDFPAGKFTGKSLDTYDAKSKKFTGIWADSMATKAMMMEGTYDKATKTTTQTGDGEGMDGKPAKWKSVSVDADDDTTDFSMYVGDAKEPMFTIVYKRKK